MAPRVPTAGMVEDHKSHFLNVDLHVESREDPASLAAALSKDLCSQSWKLGRMHHLHGSAYREGTPSQIILALSVPLKRLRGAARAVWSRASVKEFDIGIEAGFDRRAGEWIVSAEAVQAVARLGGQIRVTVYRPDLALAPERAAGKSERRR